MHLAFLVAGESRSSKYCLEYSAELWFAKRVDAVPELIAGGVEQLLACATRQFPPITKRECESVVASGLSQVLTPQSNLVPCRFATRGIYICCIARARTAARRSYICIVSVLVAQLFFCRAGVNLLYRWCSRSVWWYFKNSVRHCIPDRLPPFCMFPSFHVSNDSYYVDKESSCCRFVVTKQVLPTMVLSCFGKLCATEASKQPKKRYNDYVPAVFPNEAPDWRSLISAGTARNISTVQDYVGENIQRAPKVSRRLWRRIVADHSNDAALGQVKVSQAAV